VIVSETVGGDGEDAARKEANVRIVVVIGMLLRKENKVDAREDRIL
jgi:hypothetical protein